MSEEELKYFKGLIGFTFDSDDIRYIEKIISNKDKEIERLNNIINKYVEDMEDYLESNPPVDMQDYTYRVSDIEFLEKGIEELKFITTIREKLKELKGSDKK